MVDATPIKSKWVVCWKLSITRQNHVESLDSKGKKSDAINYIQAIAYYLRTLVQHRIRRRRPINQSFRIHVFLLLFPRFYTYRLDSFRAHERFKNTYGATKLHLAQGDDVSRSGANARRWR